MNSQAFIAKAHLLSSCPFCFKFLLFMTEAGLLDQIEVITLDHGSDEYAEQKQQLEKRAGRSVSFPTVEIDDGQFQSDTDQLINYFAAKNSIDVNALPTLSFYSNGLFTNYIALFKENMQLKKQLEK